MRAPRWILRNPTGAILTLAVLALGLSTAFAMVRMAVGISSDRLPIPNASRLVAVVEAPRLHPTAIQGVPPAVFRAWSGLDLKLGRIAAYAEVEAPWAEPGRPQRVARVAAVTPNFFALLGAHAARGRAPTSLDEAAVSARFAALLAATGTNALGARLDIGGSSFLIVGIVGPERFPLDEETWVINPYRAHRLEDASPPVYPYFHVLALLRRGVSRSALAGALAAAAPAIGSSEIRVLPLAAEAFPGESQWLRGGLVLAGALFLLGLLGFGGYVAAAIADRIDELALRTALGASRSGLIRLVAVDAAELGLAAGAAAFVCSNWIAAWIRQLGPGSGWAAAARWGGWSLGLALAMGALSGAVCGSLATWHLSRHPLAAALGSNSVVGVRAPRRHARIATVEAAFCVALACSALALGAGLRHALAGNPGFDAADAVAFRMTLTADQNRPARAANLIRRSIENIGSLPGIDSDGAINLFPLSGDEFPTPVGLRGTASSEVQADFAAVTPGYFAAMGMPLNGRTLSWSREDAVISRSLATALGAGIGGGITVMGRNYNVVGVASDIATGVAGDHSPYRIYLPWDRSPISWSAMTVVVRSQSSPSIADLQRAITAAGVNAPVENVESLRSIQQRNASQLIRAEALLAFGALFALLLAAGAIWAAAAAEVQRRSREYGLRLALGASSWQVGSGVVLSSLRISAVAVLFGLPAGVISSGALSRWLQMQPLPIALPCLSSTVLTITIITLASIPAALRARSQDPADLLRTI